jgi:very-short-patch-repair endonuclease
MIDKPLPRNKNFKPLAAKLRNSSTKEENHLWYDYLRTYPVRFNRQRIIGAYIADFFCPKAKLIIEIDGSQHYEEKAIEYDIVRTEYIERLGLKVLRFTNLDIKQDFEGVCKAIDTEVNLRL